MKTFGLLQAVVEIEEVWRLGLGGGHVGGVCLGGLKENTGVLFFQFVPTMQVSLSEFCQRSCRYQVLKTASTEQRHILSSGFKHFYISAARCDALLPVNHLTDRKETDPHPGNNPSIPFQHSKLIFLRSQIVFL